MINRLNEIYFLRIGHFVWLLATRQLFRLGYLALGLSNISGCEDRDMLSCNDVVLSNRIIDLSIVYLCWGMLALTLWVLNN